jgi:hypothetical protein
VGDAERIPKGSGGDHGKARGPAPLSA